MGPLYNAVGDRVVAALPGFHAFSGCDQTGTTCGKSKISCWNAFKKADEQVLEAFARLGSSAHIEDGVSRMLELYMCRLYLPSVHIATVKELRWFLFSKKQYPDEKLPPTKAALQQMIKRANYIALCGRNVVLHTQIFLRRHLMDGVKMVNDCRLSQPPFPLHPRLSWNL